MTAEDRDEPASRDDSPRELAKEGLDILVVDDNIDAARGMAPFLEGADCRVRAVHDGRSSLMGSLGLIAGDWVYIQFMYRDAGLAVPDAIDLSDALSFTIAP